MNHPRILAAVVVLASVAACADVPTARAASDRALHDRTDARAGATAAPTQGAEGRTTSTATAEPLPDSTGVERGGFTGGSGH